LHGRIVVAIVAVALGALVLTYLATYGLVRRSLQQNALNDLRDRSSALSTLAQEQNLASRPAVLSRALKLTDLRLVAVTPDGAVLEGPRGGGTLPAPLRPADIEPSELQAGKEVSGRRGNTVYLAIPTSQSIARGQVVIVATDTVDLSVLRKLFPLLIVVGFIVLGIAFAVASWISRRLTRPIRAIEQTAQQLAAGDLTARAEVPDATDAELATLAGTLNRMASDLETSRGSERAFLLSISHDLRTPLTSIQGYAEALADGTLDDANPEDRKRAANVISAESRRLERLVRDLLDLSRLDSHQFSLSPRPSDANEVVNNTVEAFAPKAAEMGLTLAVASSAPIAVDLDPERLGQIVANLVENALKYAVSRVDVYAAPHDDQSHFAIVVHDDGPGIPPEKLGLVFERLYTERDTPGRAVGTGLGLAIVRELSSAMGGHAWAEAHPDGGTRFVVSLPTNVAARA
jgi:two-component system sensor histidine kinase BaeS